MTYQAKAASLAWCPGVVQLPSLTAKHNNRVGEKKTIRPCRSLTLPVEQTLTPRCAPIS